MRRCSSVLLLAPALALIDPAGGQTLDLDGTAPAGPPPLGLGTYAADLSRVLQHEMEQIAAGAEGADADTQLAALASIKLRDLAVRLLDQGDEAGPAGSVAALTGVRLVRGRDQLDRLLAGVAGDGGQEPARAALRRYLDPGHGWSTAPDPADPAALDAALAAHVEPLADAARLLVPGETVNHWVTTEQIGVERNPSRAAIDDILGVLVGTADTIELTGDGGDALRRTLEYLQRGAAFEQFRPQVREYAGVLTEVLGLAADVDAAAWLTEDQRATCREIIAEAIVRFADRQSRAAGLDRLRGLVAARRILARITTLAETARAASPGRSRTDTPRLDMEPVTRAFGAVITAAGRDPAGDTPQADRLAAILDRMIAYRELRTPALTRELRDAWRKLHNGYERTEHGIIETLPQLAAEPGALSDPALASLIADHRQYLDDLRRLETVPLWMETVRNAAPRASGPFGGRLRRLVVDLGAPGRRQEAVRAIDDLDRRMQAYFPLPFEQRLVDGDRAAIIATGGLHEQLAVEIDRQRRVWAEAWGDGDDGEAGARLQMLHELLQVMADTAPLVVAEADAITLDRWAAWELDAATIDRIGAELRNRLKLATTAAVDGDDTGLTEQLARIPAGQTALIATLLTRLAPPLAQLPSGPLGTLGQCIEGPGPDAWLAGRRRVLADLCRYTMEMEYARSTGRDQLAGELEAWIDGAAVTLMKEITP